MAEHHATYTVAPPVGRPGRSLRVLLAVIVFFLSLVVAGGDYYFGRQALDEARADARRTATLVAQRSADALASAVRSATTTAERNQLGHTATFSLMRAYGESVDEIVVTDAAGTLLIGAPPGRRSVANGFRTSGWIYGTAEVPGLRWHVAAGIEPGRVVGPVRRLLVHVAMVAGTAVLLGLLAVFVLSRRVSRPLADMSAAVSQVARQVTPTPVRTAGTREVRLLIDEFNQMVASRTTYETKLSHQALHDGLTGLPNRALFMDRLTLALDRAEGARGLVAVVAVDIDGFRRINDSLGHEVGDSVLRAVASRLSEVVRQGDTLARFGADEFVVLLDGVANVDEARAFAQAVAGRLELPVLPAGRQVTLTACLGVALGAHGDAGDDLVRDAHSALSRAKEGGGNRFEVFDAAIRTSAATRFALESELRLAIERDELHIEYQPKVDLATGEIVGAEALLRWEHGKEGAIPPARFITVAEETGLILPIGRWVLQHACQQAATWARSHTPLAVSVNLSARQLRDDDVRTMVADVLGTTALQPQLLCLELTESMLLDDPERTIEVLHQLRQLGIRLSVDDFGTGYSSLSYLQRFPVDELKIDRAFVHGLDEGEQGRSLLAAIVAMAHALSLQVVAEGVETADQAAQLLTLGAHAAQGYFFARPQSPAQLTAMLQRRGIAVTSIPPDMLPERPFGSGL